MKLGKLGKRRVLFSLLIVKLGSFINSVPRYSFYFGDGKCVKGHCKNSLHYRGLAQDVNLFFDGEYQQDTESHAFIGDYWKSLHPQCTWGGDFKRKDGNHYSFGEGVK